MPPQLPTFSSVISPMLLIPKRPPLPMEKLFLWRPIIRFMEEDAMVFIKNISKNNIIITFKNVTSPNKTKTGIKNNFNQNNTITAFENITNPN